MSENNEKLRKSNNPNKTNKTNKNKILQRLNKNQLSDFMD